MDAVSSTVLLAQLMALLLGAWPSLSSAKCSFTVINDLRISPITAFQAASGKLFLMDRSDLDNSRFVLPSGESVHAVEYDIAANVVKPKSTVTNTWCSGGGYLPDGTLVNTGGNDAGVKEIRVLKPCNIGSTSPNPPGPCDEWFEDPNVLVLNETRWYPGSAILPNGDIFILGGSTSGGGQTIPNWEIVQPFKKRTNPSVFMQFLKDAEPNNLYPFVHLLPYGNLFIFANTKGIVFDYKNNKIVANVPEIPDKKSRQYVATGSSVMLPLSYADNFQKVEILICGGSDLFPTTTTVAAKSCYRIDVSQSLLASGFQWQGLEPLATPRVMPDMVFLLDGTVAIINGMQKGFAGFGTSATPTKTPELYTPTAPFGQRINSKLGCSSKLTRSYHSEATLVPDGRVLLTGGNLSPTFEPKLTQYSVEEWRPPYLFSTIPRPSQLRSASTSLTYGQAFTVTFTYPLTGPKGTTTPSSATVTGALISPAVTTHSNSYNLRYLQLRLQSFIASGATTFTASFVAPPTATVAPPGYYMFSLAHEKLPASAIWLRLG